MGFIEEFRAAGLVKSKKFEAYVDKETEKLTKELNKQEMDGTTTANVPTTVQPFKDKDEEAAPEKDEPKTVEDDEKDKEGRKLLLQKSGKIIESVAKLAEAYEDITGEKLHELYCPNCKPYDISPANPDKGVPFGPKVPGGKGQDNGDHPMGVDNR
jgi:hypothetical protein